MILPEYLETVFLAETPHGGWPQLFHIITAWNPGKILDEVTNKTADESLRTLLNREGSRCFRVTGCSPDLKHQEPGWGVAGLSRSRAVDIANEYQQNALFEISAGRINIVGCQSQTVQQVGIWAERCR